MKIFCIGRNYAEHAKELNNAVPTKPLVFMKPPTAILREGTPYFYPDFTKDLHYEGELVLRICKNGKAIEPEFAHKYFDQVTVGIDITARDLQEELKQKGQPWEIAKGFDGSAVVGEFRSTEGLNMEHIRFQLWKNGAMVQDGHTNELIFPFSQLIAYISKFFTLQQGDLIYTGTPAGVGPVTPGDLLEGFLEGEKVMECYIK